MKIDKKFAGVFLGVVIVFVVLIYGYYSDSTPTAFDICADISEGDSYTEVQAYLNDVLSEYDEYDADTPNFYAIFYDEPNSKFVIYSKNLYCRVVIQDEEVADITLADDFFGP